MNLTNLEHTRIAHQSPREINRDTDSTRVGSNSHANAAVGARNTTLQLLELHASTRVRKLSPGELPNAQSYGGILFSPDGRVLIREPIDHLAGYVWTWPKGKPEKGETPDQTALREVHEETGYRARIIGALPKAYRGITRTTAFFLMEPVGEQGDIINETAQTRWVGYEEALSLIKLTKHAIGRDRDRAILIDALHCCLTPILGLVPTSVSAQCERHLR